MRKSHFNDEFLVLLGPIISRFFACSNEEKKLTQTTKGACSSPISMGTRSKWDQNWSLKKCLFLMVEFWVRFLTKLGNKFLSFCMNGSEWNEAKRHFGLKKAQFSALIIHKTHLEQKCTDSSPEVDSILLKAVRNCKQFYTVFLYGINKGILKGEVSLCHWPPVWLVWNQLYDNWQFLFLFAKQTNPNQSNMRSKVQWCFFL